MASATRGEAGTSKGSVWEPFREGFQAEYLAGIDEHVQRLTWDADRIEAAQRDGLHRLFAHAIEHSPFHARRLAGIEVDRVDPRDLSGLPVMTKADMMAALDDVFTDRRLSRSLVERALAATTADPVPILDEYVAYATGGSSGQRGVFVFDRATMAGFLLSVSRSLVARLRALGDAAPGGFRIAMVGAASGVHLTRAAAAATAGAEMPFHIVSVPVTLPLAHIVDQLNALRAPGLFGYPSMLVRLAAEQRARRLRLNPAVVTTTSETLLPETAEEIAEAFGAPVVNNFASTEGLVGNSAPGESVLAFNSDLCIVELLDSDHRPVPPGVPSTRVLVTNLYNLAQPLIRYELTDTFVRQPDAPGHGYLRARVEGRADEILHYGEIDVHPLVLRSVLVKNPEIIDYQVLQTPRGVDVEAIVAGPTDTGDLTRRLAGALGRAGLNDPVVAVRMVDALDRHHETGKLRRFVPLPER